MPLRLTILGSGTSHGVPMIGCDCDVCRSPDPRDRRMRCSAVFSWEGATVLIDTGPELRLQCIANGITNVDAILFTHFHADHVVGLDDVRRFNRMHDGPLPIYGDAATIARLQQMFGYAFVDDPSYPSAKPQLVAHEINGTLKIAGREITPIRYLHGRLPVYGFRIGSMAYCPDCSQIPDDAYRQMQGLDVLVLDALRRRPHPTHLHLEQAEEVARRIGAKRTFFTHIAHELGHAATNAALPAGIELAYDGLVVSSE